MEKRIDKIDKRLYSASTTMTPVIYKDFYKTYYSEKLKVFNVVAVIVAAVAIVGAIYILKNDYGKLWGAIATWIGIFLLFYPRMIYRKPYKRAKDTKQTTHFSFHENFMTEKTNSHTEHFKYTDLKKILETNKYFFIFHSAESVSIVDKSHISCDSEEMSSFLKTKSEYKRIKK